MTDHLVYLATGPDDILSQAQHSILTALAWSAVDEMDVRVYTDRPDAFTSLGDARVKPIPLSPERCREWRGRWDFFFRMKPAVIADTMRGHPGEKVLFIDADTYFTGPVADAFARIGERRAVMHVREYVVATRDSLQMRNFRRRLRRSRFRGEPVSLDFWMWNSGAVGLHPAHEPFLDEWVAFVDEVYPTNPKPIVEQYGLSLLLQRAALEIAPVDDLLFHYYDDKGRHLAAIRARLAALPALPAPERARVLREERIAFEGPPPRPPKPARFRRIWASVRQKALLGVARLRRDATQA